MTTNTDNATFTNYLYAPVINYVNNTTVSNGVLALSVPNDLSSSPIITLAASNAVLDASSMGYVLATTFLDINSNPNSFLVTNGVLQILAATPAGTPQVLAGFGSIKGSVVSSGTISPGSPTAGGTLSISNGLTINAGASNIFDLSSDITKPGDQINVQGNVTLSGGSSITIQALNGVLTPGNYPLITYTGNLTNSSGGVVPPGPISDFTVGGTFFATSHATFVLSNNPGAVVLTILSLNNLNLTWRGDSVSNLWDITNSITWVSGAAPTNFFQLDNVTFDDSAPLGNDSVGLSGALVPTSILVNNSLTNYMFGGNGSIGGVGTLIKTGTGTLILTNSGANTYTGGTILSNGVLNVGIDSGANQNDSALGTGPVTVNSPAELHFGGNGGGTVVNHFIRNAITVNGGVIKADDGAQHLTNSTVTITAAGGALQTVFATKNLVLDSPLLGTGNVTILGGRAFRNQCGGWPGHTQ